MIRKIRSRIKTNINFKNILLKTKLQQFTNHTQCYCHSVVTDEITMPDVFKFFEENRNVCFQANNKCRIKVGRGCATVLKCIPGSDY